MDTFKDKIISFLASYFPNYNLKDDDNIFTLGFVNSLFAMQLVLFVEKEFDISVENEDLDIKNFESINALAHFISLKRAAASQS